MAKKKANILDRIEKLGGAGKVAAPKLEKLEKTKGKKHGGARTGSGRQPLEKDEKRRTLKRSWEDFAQEDVEIPVKELHKGTKEERKVKMKRIRVAQEKLFGKVVEGDVSAIREFNDRVHGKSPQTLRGDEDEAPVRVEVGLDRVLDKVYGDEDEK